VLAPKLAGTLALRHAFGDMSLDFVALCSSVTAVSGDFGQVDYCAANTFMDAYAASAHGWRAPVVSHNWSGWAEVGMAVEVAAPAGLRAHRGPVAEPIDHPILSSRTGTECHGLVSAGTHWVLDQHRIGGVPVVPGTAHLECVRAAVAAGRTAPGDGHVVELRDVGFLKPFAVPATAEYRVVLADDEFQVVSSAEGRTEVHARGSAGWALPAPASTVDVDAIRDRCKPIEDGNGFGQTGRTSMLTFGPRWSALREHFLGAQEELALVVAPEPSTSESWVLEPALLDVATAFGRGRGAGAYLPLGYGRVLVRGALPARFYSHLRYQGAEGDKVIAADLTMCDESGRVLVEIEDFTLRRVDQDAVRGGLTEPVATADEASVASADAAPMVVQSTASGMIRPADGAEAFRRALAPYLGHRVVISPVPVADIFAGRVTTDEIAEDNAAETDTTVETDGAGVVATGDITPPRTETESLLVELWRGVLGVDRLGVDQDFFVLGGNSLVAVQLIAQIRKATGVRLPMRVLFDAPTVAELAVQIEELKRGGGGATKTIPKLSR
jgi:phthiocerol/phenolphthiocerol synthesis type-I polyketide synthase E